MGRQEQEGDHQDAGQGGEEGQGTSSQTQVGNQDSMLFEVGSC